ncbi:MAG: acyl-CoA dehydrogenase family protein [Actinobacteria bacterium]|nr:acyl-CoA dehydrogenase family protein [Actinomycetota bacterium]
MEPPGPSRGYPPSAVGEAALARVRAFVADEALPMVEEVERRRGSDTAFALERDGRLADDVIALKRAMQQASAVAGLYCPHLAEAYGGLGLSLVDTFYVQEEVYRHGLRGTQWMLAWTDGPSPLVRHWSYESRARYLPDFLGGRTSVAFALSEPGAGTDALALETSARADGDGWALTGVKHLITGAPFVEQAQVLARIEGDGRRELTAFLVPMDAPGVVRGPVQQTLMSDGQTGVIEFHDVRVPSTAIIGERGRGMDEAFLWINWARSRRGGMCSGLAWHCLDRSVRYAHEREAFGKPIAGLGAIAERLSDIYMDWRAMRAMSLEILAGLDAANLLGDGPAGRAERRDLSTLKTWCDEALMRVSDKAIQVHGGRGLLTATGIERIFRVARNLRIPAGTTEIQRAMIAETLAADERAFRL